ncbi:MAG: hypothetical protein HY785_15455 [Oscillatoriophycideae cyanobacterium NC_groundwater_1537_Pr4_S-0.65um_50_18]|nr:hypothetical protein [Oscillatoriophycideae cyanobacterium NC_groundwater_1537_Pr4_S-0.65um_50_18]
MPDALGHMLLPPILQQRYTAATQLAETGEIAAALIAYQEILQADSGQSLQGVVTGEFLALVELHKAHCHQILGNDQAAHAIFEEMDRYWAGQLSMADLYIFYFSYGNTLGRLGLLKDMEDRLAHAMNIALEELADRDKFREVWDSVLYWEKHHEEWSLLAEHSQSAYEFGVQDQDIAMQRQAIAYRCIAEHSLGQYEPARRSAEEMLRLVRDVDRAMPPRPGLPMRGSSG